ncbi:MAG TPA: methylated-DNA--[protein]-cysteine S-methyltransferase [Acidimicrobiia bacterium]
MNSHTIRSSPVGVLTLVADEDDRLCRLEFTDAPESDAGPPTAAAPDDAPRGVLAETVRQLDEYFAGTRHEFELDLAPQGTAFQLDVWHALRAIPYGATASYADIARSVGRPNAVRAVGQANGRNPLAIVVPCHRVIGSDHSLTGYGGGIDRKRYLLALEGAQLTVTLDL